MEIDSTLKENSLDIIKEEINSRKRHIDEDEELEPTLFKIGSKRDVKDIHIHKDEVNIGRSRDSDVPILNTLISRNHCRLKRTMNNEWSVTNLSSTVTLLNDEPIPRGHTRKINFGDTLQLSDSADFKFLFSTNPKCEDFTKKTCLEQNIIDNEVERQKTQFAKNQAIEKKHLEDKLAIEKQKQTNLQEQLEILLKKQDDNEKDDEKLKEQILLLEKKIEFGNITENDLKLKYEQLVIKLEDEKRKFEEKMAEEKQKYEEQLENTKKEKETLEATLKVKEAEWQNKMDNVVKEEQNVREKLSNEKQQLEEKMKKLEEAIKEKELKNKEIINNLEGKPINLENECIVFEVKNSGDIEILETIDLTNDIVEVVTTQPAQKEAFDIVNNIMEEQLTCSICSELFVSAITLNCTHTFCQYCIQIWMKKSKDCPNCRSRISVLTKSLVLDNFIEKMVENISAEQKQRRSELIQERSRQIPKLHSRILHKRR